MLISMVMIWQVSLKAPGRSLQSVAASQKGGEESLPTRLDLILKEVSWRVAPVGIEGVHGFGIRLQVSTAFSSFSMDGSNKAGAFMISVAT